MASSDDTPTERRREAEPTAPRETVGDPGERTVFDDGGEATPPPGGGARDLGETTRLGIEGLGDRTVADLREIVGKLDQSWRRREPGSGVAMESLGPYTELVEIGRGGMGIVYRARDPKTGGFVALKVPMANWIGDPSARPRFLREARLLKALHHPAILTCLDSGEAGGRWYLAGEYCDGPDLAAWLKRRTSPVPANAAARLVAALAEAVAHAHDRGVLHRDLKPSNVLLDGARDSTDPMNLSPKLTDFGLAKLMDPLDDDCDGDEETMPQALTRTGILLGSPPYMAPEQVAASPNAVGPWTDVYGIGAILYEVLTGRPPFRGENPSETLRLVRETDPIPVRVLRAGVPRALETITLKCLEKEPARRYGSARFLADDLHRFLEGRSILAKPTSRRERLRRLARRRPALASLVAATVVGLAMILGGVFAWNLSLRKYVRIIAAERERADQNVYDSGLQLAAKAMEAGQLGRAQLVLRDLIPRPGAVDRRDFTWGHLWRLSRREAQLVDAEAGEITGMAVSADGRRLAATNGEGELTVFDPVGEKPLWSHRWRARVEVERPAFSADGDLLAVVAGEEDDHADFLEYDWRVEVRDAESGASPRLSAPFRARRVDHLGFLDHNALLVAAITISTSEGDKRRVAVWEMGEGETAAPRLRSISEPRPWLELAPDAASFATLDSDGLPVILDVKTRKPRRSLANAPADLDRRAFFAADGARVAMTRGDEAFVWETATGRLLHRARSAGGTIKSITLQPGGDALLVVGDSQEVRLIDPPRGLDKQVFPPANGQEGIETTHLSFAPGGGEFLVNRTEYWEADRVQLRSTVDGTPRLESPGRQMGRLGFWDLQTRDGADPALIYSIRRYLWRWDWTKGFQEIAAEPLAAHHDEIWDVEYSPDGSIRVTAGDDDLEPLTIKLWDARSDRLIRGWRGQKGTATDLSFSADGRRLASSSLDEDDPVHVWEFPSGRSLIALKFSCHESARAVRFDRRGSWLVAAGNRGGLKAWDARTYAPIWERRYEGDRIHDVAFNPRGDRLAAACDSGFLRVLDAATGALLFEFRAPGSVLATRYGPDGRVLAAADREGSVFLFDAETTQLIRTIRSDDRQLYGLAFSPDGKTMAVGGHGRTVRLYDSETGNELLSLEGHEAQVNGVVFSPDGLTLASADHQGVVRLWRASRGPSSRSD